MSGNTAEQLTHEEMPKGPELRVVENQEKKIEKPKIELNQNIDPSNRLWVMLLSGHQADVIRVSRPDLIKGSEIKLHELDKDVIKNIDLEDPKAAEIMKQQIDRAGFTGHEIKLISTILRAFGPDVFMLREIMNADGDMNYGLDQELLGKPADLDKGPVFIIAASRDKEMKALLQNPPAMGIDMAEHLDIEPWDYLHNDGFIAKYRHKLPGQGEIVSEIRFLYARDTNIKSKEEFVKSNEVSSEKEETI